MTTHDEEIFKLKLEAGALSIKEFNDATECSALSMLIRGEIPEPQRAGFALKLIQYIRYGEVFRLFTSLAKDKKLHELLDSEKCMLMFATIARIADKKHAEVFKRLQKTIEPILKAKMGELKDTP